MIPGLSMGQGASLTAQSSAAADTGPLTMGGFNFQPAGKTSTVAVVGLSVVAVLLVVSLVRGRK